MYMQHEIQVGKEWDKNEEITRWGKQAATNITYQNKGWKNTLFWIL